MQVGGILLLENADNAAFRLFAAGAVLIKVMILHCNWAFAIILLPHFAIILLPCFAIILILCYCALLLSYYHTLLLSYCHTLLLSYYHAVSTKLCYSVMFHWSSERSDDSALQKRGDAH